MANGFDARQFAETTLGAKGSGDEFVASHGLEVTKISRTSVADLTRRAAEAEVAKKKAWDEYAKCESDLKTCQETKKKAIESLQSAEKTIKQLRAECNAEDASLAESQKELVAVKADFPGDG